MIAIAVFLFAINVFSDIHQIWFQKPRAGWRRDAFWWPR
jgi:hypothetical protein